MDTCDRTDPQRRCEWRYRAVLEGRFKWQTVPWEICPGCGRGLPDLDDATIETVKGWLVNNTFTDDDAD